MSTASQPPGGRQGEGSTPPRRRALIIEDQTTFRELLSEVLHGSGNYEVTTCATGAEARAALQRARFDLVLLDLVLPDVHGLELLDALRLNRSLRIVVLTAHSRPAVVKSVIEAGAHGVLTKGAPLRELREAIDRVITGGVYYCTETSRLLHESTAVPEQTERLTARQLQILRAVAQGKTTREIAESFGLSEKTVSNHRTHIMERVGARDVASLTRYAVTRGLIDPAS
jgi:DNA-binding NarL/FixJ family response regulator